MSDRIAVFHDGRIQQLADPATLYNEPANRFVASFIGENNSLPCTLLAREGGLAVVRMADGTTLKAAGADVSGTGTDISLSIRPENISLGGEGVRADLNRFTGKTRDVFFLGDHMRLSIEAFGGQVVTARIPARQALHFASGTDVVLECCISECRLLEV
jgi:putative spermidine/putrescine transport system ATP-binding protein